MNQRLQVYTGPFKLKLFLVFMKNIYQKEFWRIKQHWFWYNCWGNLDKFARKLVINSWWSVYKKATKIWRLIHKIWVVLIFHYRVRVGFYGGNLENHPTHPSLDSPLKLVLWKFLFLSIQFDLLSNFYLFYCNNINKRTGEINNFLYWNLKTREHQGKITMGQFCLMEISSPSLFKFAHREFYWLDLLEQTRDWSNFLIFV